MLNSLNVALSGLQASKTQVENVMNNIANENTVGYKKRVVDVKEAENSDARLTGRGATVEGVDRITNIYMYDNLISEQSKSAEHDELSTMLADIESIFFETETSGMSNNLDGFFQAIEDLRSNPYNEIYRTNLINQGNILVDGVKSIYGSIEERERIAKSFALDHVNEINGILNDIGAVNQLIQDAIVPSNDMLDKRDLLESRLSEYVEIKVDRSESYALELGGVTAVRYNTNIHEVHLATDEFAQKDVYAQDDPLTLVPKSTLVESSWGLLSEEQTIEVGGISTGSVSFLGHPVALSVAGETAVQTVGRIIADKANIISAWNALNPTKEISDITSLGTTLTIVYEGTQGDVPLIDQAQSNGIVFGESVETIKGADTLTYYFDKDNVITVTAGEDLYGDGTFIVTKDNIVQALVHKINNDPEITKEVVAYNGQYAVDEDGNKIPKAPTNIDHYLMIESKIAGSAGEFTGRVIVNDNNVVDGLGDPIATLVEKNSIKSVVGHTDVHLEIFDQEVPAVSGKLKSILDNIDTTSGANKFDKYKQMLDDFVKSLADISEAYIFQGENEYVFGEEASLLHQDAAAMKRIGLFEGTDVSNFAFNSAAVRNLTQADLDYLSLIHWNENVMIGESETSFSKYYQSIRIAVSADKENVDYLKETQEAVTESLTLTYDKLTKVDKDDEMVNLIKFQAAYEANAKLVTIVDEMLQTILGMKR